LDNQLRLILHARDISNTVLHRGGEGDLRVIRFRTAPKVSSFLAVRNVTTKPLKNGVPTVTQPRLFVVFCRHQASAVCISASELGGALVDRQCR